jgi:hypothetical protein
VESVFLPPELVFPLADSLLVSHGLAIKGQNDIVAFVIGLLLYSGPAAVSRFVIPVFVRPPVERILWRGAWTEVGEKTLEACLAIFTEALSITDRDAPATVIFVGLVFLLK